MLSYRYLFFRCSIQICFIERLLAQQTCMIAHQSRVYHACFFNPFTSFLYVGRPERGAEKSEMTIANPIYMILR